MRRPWIPLNIGDFLQDTGHLSTVEIGGYILMIMHYWAKGGPLPNRDAYRRVTRMTARQWSSSGDILMSFFRDDLSHARLDKELAKVIEKSNVNSANAKRRHVDGTETAGVSLADNPADKRLNTEQRDVEGTREREPAKPLVSVDKQAAIALGLAFVQAAGFADYAEAPMNWYGVADRAALWIANGWTAEAIVAETRLITARAGTTMPITYYEKCFATAAAKAAAPLPIAIVKSAETVNVAQADQSRSTSAAAERLRRRLEQDDASTGVGSSDGTVRLLA